MKSVGLLWLIAAFVLPLTASFAQAQNEKTIPPTTTKSTLIAATEASKAAAKEVFKLQSNELEVAVKKLEELRTLVAEGLVARNELLEAEQQLSALKERLLASEPQISQADQLIEEIRSREEPFKIVAAVNNPKSSSKVKPTSWRSKGSSVWSLNQIGAIQAFFASKFGRSLPISTIGQSPTHNQLRWDHRNAADIALHPDSAEGKALLGYLQAQGIPFLAFRGAIPGVSTGPHIHIGVPSNRLL